MDLLVRMALPDLLDSRVFVEKLVSLDLQDPLGQKANKASAATRDTPGVPELLAGREHAVSKAPLASLERQARVAILVLREIQEPRVSKDSGVNVDHKVQLDRSD